MKQPLVEELGVSQSDEWSPSAICNITFDIIEFLSILIYHVVSTIFKVSSARSF